MNTLAALGWELRRILLTRTLGTGEMVYHLTTSFLVTRVGLVLAGVALLFWATRRRPC